MSRTRQSPLDQIIAFFMTAPITVAEQAQQTIKTIIVTRQTTPQDVPLPMTGAAPSAAVSRPRRGGRRKVARPLSLTSPAPVSTATPLGTPAKRGRGRPPIQRPVENLGPATDLVQGDDPIGEHVEA
jgi:hypothetical protein